MPDRIEANEPSAIWKSQPEEKLAVNFAHIVNRRTEELHSSTRSEILMSIGAAVLFVAVMAWRFAPSYGSLQSAVLAVVLAWVAFSLYRFRRRIWAVETPPPDAAAAPGLEFYRRELERRRDHLRNAWLWHGPLVLACLLLAGILIERAYPGPERLKSALPLVGLLAVWTGFGLRRRLRQAADLQREIDEIQAR